LDEKRILDVINIEKQADEIYSKSVAESERIPQQAEQEAKILVENARLQAEKDAQSILASSQTTDEIEHILQEAESTIKHHETLAKHNSERATTYVISRIVGRG